MNTINPNDSKDALSKTPFKNFAIGVIVILIFLIGHSLFAQVGVGNTNPQAQLDISASNTTSPTNQDGILIPRVTNLPADASMTANQDGMMVFYDNTGEDGKGFYYWDDTAGDWIKIAAGNLNDDDWTVNGANIERQSGNVYIGDVPSTNNDLYISDQIIDWDNVSYIINPDGDNKINEIELDDGGLTDPSLYFEGDTDFGLTYNSLSNRIFLVENGSQRLGVRKDGGIEPYNGIKIGINAGLNNTSNTNIFIGQAAGSSNTTGTLNYGIGNSSLSSVTTNGINVAVGDNTLTDYIGNAVPGNNVSIGHYSMRYMIDGSLNTAVGIGAMENINFNSNSNVAIGTYALRNLVSGTENTVLGYSAGNSSDGFHNLYLGFGSGYNADGDRNIFLGYRSGYNAPIGSDMLYIENSNSNTPLVYGEFDNDILRINGELQVGIPASTGYAFPTVDGTANQIMATDGSGQVSFVNASSLFTDTDDQNLTAASLTGTTLNLGIQNGTGTSVNLAALQDGTGTDDQTIDNFSLVGTTLRLSLEDDGQPLQTVNLASINTDDQNIQNLAFNTSTNILTVGIENGTAQTVDLSALDSGGDITQINAGNGLTGGGTTGAVTINAVGTNGITTNANDFRLGGNLIQNTTITNNTFDMIFNVNSSGTFKVQDGGVDKFEMNTFGDAVFGGDLYLRDENSNATSTILARLIDSDDDGVLEIYQGGSISNRIHGNGTSFFNAGKVAIGQTTADGFLEILAANNGTEPHIKLVHNGASGARINFTNTATTSNVWTLFGNTDDTAANSVFNFFHSGTGNIMQITGDGKVAVGAAITEGTFNVTGDTYHSDDIYLRDGAVNSGSILARLYDSADDGVLDLYEGGAVNHSIHGNGLTYFNLQNLDIDFRIESQTRTYAFMVDASENLVRMGDFIGNTPQQGTTKTVNGITFNVDYVASITDGGIGSSLGYGTAEFITDAGNNITMMDSNFIPFNDNDDALGRSDYRWTALWAVDGTINTSDLSLKRNVQPLNYGLDALMNVETITYQWKNSQFNDTKIGFSAQNLQNIIPEVVRDYDIVVTDELTNTKKKVPSQKLGVYYSDMIPITVKAIQELNKKIETLETENTILKDKLSRLEALEARLLAVEKSMNNVNTNTSVSHTADE